MACGAVQLVLGMLMLGSPIWNTNDSLSLSRQDVVSLAMPLCERYSLKVGGVR